jgi:hypothetical protein
MCLLWLRFTHQLKNQDLVNINGQKNIGTKVKNHFFSLESLESSITKDNPAFSMVNDSEEDIPFGSDEESHKPLNPPNDDSD